MPPLHSIRARLIFLALGEPRAEKGFKPDPEPTCGSTPDADNADEGKLVSDPRFAGFLYRGDMMEVIINGNTQTGDFSTVASMLEKNDLDPKFVVVELNGKILPKEEYQTMHLKDGDTVEIVQFVAGG